MAQHIEQKIMEVHQHLDAFELQFLARPAPTVDVMTLHATVKILIDHLDTILVAQVLES